MARTYEVLFYNGWQDMPAYYLVGAVQGRTPREALGRQLLQIIHSVREQFLLPPDVDDDYVCGSLYVLKPNALVGVSALVP